MHGRIRTTWRFSARPSDRFAGMARTASLCPISECVSLNGPGRCADSRPCSWIWWNAPSGWKNFWTVIATHLVHIDQGQGIFPGQMAEHMFAQNLLSGGEGRGGEVDDGLGAGLGEVLDGILVIASPDLNISGPDGRAYVRAESAFRR